MSGWGSWFGGGGSAQKKKDTIKNSILQLRQTHEMLMKREKHLQNQIDDSDAKARKQLAAGNKAGAKTELRRKKTMEHSLEQTSSQMLRIEQEISSIESANINKETLDAMTNAGKAMKQIHNGMTLDKVDSAMADLEEQHAISEEIADALSSAPLGQHVDEDELDEELAELQQEQLDEKMMKTGHVPVGDTVDRLPTVSGREPSRKQPAAAVEDEEDEELKRLQAEMAM